MAITRDRAAEEAMAQELLKDLFTKIEQAHERAKDRDRFTVEPGSSLAGDNRATQPYQLSHTVVAAMNQAVEHLHTIRALIVGAGVMHPAAPFTLARAAIETASIAVWLMSPSSRKERVMRRLRLALEDAKDSDRAGAEIGSPSNLAVARRRLDGLAAAAANDPGYTLKSGVNTTDIVRAADTQVDRTHVLTAWRVCAGFSHGRIWTTLAVLDRNEVPNEGEPDVMHLYVTNSLPKLHWVVATSWKVVDHAQELYQERRVRHY